MTGYVHFDLDRLRFLILILRLELLEPPPLESLPEQPALPLESHLVRLPPPLESHLARLPLPRASFRVSPLQLERLEMLPLAPSR